MFILCSGNIIFYWCLPTLQRSSQMCLFMRIAINITVILAYDRQKCLLIKISKIHQKNQHVWHIRSVLSSDSNDCRYLPCPIVLFYEITIDYVRAAGQCIDTVECTRKFLCIIYKYCCNIFRFLYILLDFFWY